MVVTVSGDRPIHDVAKDLKDAGFNVEQVLDQIGVVTGSADPEHAERFRSIEGIADVAAEHPPFDIGPPGAPVS